MMRRIISAAIALVLVIQLLPAYTASAVMPSDLTTRTEYLTVHGTDYTPSSMASSLTITQADGSTVIAPDAGGDYHDIPSGARIFLDYAFSLEDGDAGHTVTYDYDGNEYFTATLPGGLNFAAASGTVVAHDSTGGYDYDLATWSIAGNILTVALTYGSEDTSGHDGAANNAHLAKWGKVHIEGTFQPLGPGDDTTLQITFGSQTITIHRQPLPMESTLAKTGSYDASTNEITWTVTVTPPAGDPGLSYDGYTIIDEYGANQDYVAGSFTVGGVPVLDASLTIAGQQISYTFPDITGIQTITYKTTPTGFAGENGVSADLSTYSNTVRLLRGSDVAADPVTADVTLDWIDKTGEMADTAASDPTIVKWTVRVTVPGEIGKSVTGAVITDAIHPDLELLADGAHPVMIQFGSGAAANVSSGGADGEYSYAGNILTYRFPTADQPTAGTDATLTFYTKVTAVAWSSYLDSNDVISFENTARFGWDENITLTYPSHTVTLPNGIGGGGLLSKSAGPATDYSYLDPGIIHWTITVNRNKINIVNAKLTDLIPAGQTLLIDLGHAFTVTRQGTPSDTITITSPASSGGFTYVDPNQFTYEFPEESPGTDTISATYTVDYYTSIVDPSGLTGFYKNGTSALTNGVTLTRNLAANVSVSGEKVYNSQMVDKSVATAYNYTEHTVRWQIVVNRNRLPLTNATLTDILPTDMTLLIDATHPVVVTSASGGGTGTFAGGNGDTSFTLTLPTPTTDQFTITFWARLNDSALKTSWNGTKNYTNSARLDSDEISTPIISTSAVSIRNPVVSKTYAYTPGSDTIDWSVVINPAQILLQNAQITDVLNPGLLLDPASVKLSTVSIHPGTGNVASTTGLVDPADYTVTLPTSANGNTLTVALPAATSSAYRLEFSTAILTDDVSLTNTVSLSGTDTSGSSTSDQIVVTDLYSSGGSGTSSLTVHKTDSFGNPLQGATFRLLNVNKQPITKLGSEITQTTNASGDAVFLNLPSWVFYVEEIDPVPGYLIPADPISGGNRLIGVETINVTNSLARTNVSFGKTGANGALLSGGTFTLTGFDYALNPVSKTASAVNGIATFTDVAPNKTGEPYTITETAAPAGHSLSGTTLSAAVGYNAAKNTLAVTVTPNSLVNTPQSGTVSFQKTGTGGALLSGGSFTLTGTDYAGNAVSKTASAVSGVIAFDDVPIGSYQITEVTPPAGYLMPTATVILTATVAYNADNTGIVTTLRSVAAGTPVVTSYANTQALGDISFSKLDSTDRSPISGGLFSLTGMDYTGTNVSMTASSVGGTVTFTGVPLGDDYTIRELTPPAGYLLTGTVLDASVEYNADKTAVVTSISAVELTNDRAPLALYANLTVIKTDESGNRLAGAEFTLYNSLGVVMATAVSNEEGVALFFNVVEGTGYTIRETRAPAGYVLSPESIDVAVTSSLPQTFTVVNIKEALPVGSLQIMKVDSANRPLADAEFSLYDGEGKLIGRTVSGSDGMAVFNGLAPGSYSVYETAAPEGYIRVTSPLEIDVEAGAVISFTLRNSRETDSGVAGWTGDDCGALPSTGGMPVSLIFLLAGLLLIFTGVIIGMPKRFQIKHMRNNGR